jgi:hypothetical protein
MNQRYSCDSDYLDSIERSADLLKLIERTQLALKWISGEIAICNNVFPVGHKQRKVKIGARMSVMQLLGDVLTKLELEQAAIEEIPSFQPTDVVYTIPDDFL